MNLHPQKSMNSSDSPKFISRRGLASRWDKHIVTIRRLEKRIPLTPHILPETRDVVYRVDEIEAIEENSKLQSSESK